MDIGYDKRHIAACDERKTPMPVTALYASLLAIIFIFLAVRVIKVRSSEKVSLGDGGKPDLIRRMRVHGNFTEYVPMALVLLALAESVHTEPVLLHVLGILLVIARCLHAWGMSQSPENFRFRVAGMAMTFTVIGITALVCFFGSLWQGWLI